MTTSDNRKIYPLSKLSAALEKHFMKHFARTNFWVTAEIVKINYKSGHAYLELADTKENITTAQSSAHIWATNLRKIKQILGDDYSNIVKNGNKALFQVKIEYHKVFGLKLNILDIDPSFSFGEIEKRKKETIEKLKIEGLFDNQKQLFLSTLSKRIALIGSPKTSGYRDFKDELFNNASYRNFKVKSFSTSVQGDAAKIEIIKAIEEARLFDVDAIVIIRGGGSKMDLDIFNDYDIAKVICETQIPVLTGIGHESDEVVADLVSYQHFITPTAVAKHLWTQIREFRYFVTKYYDQVSNLSLSLLGGHKDEFYHTNKYLVHYTKELLREWNERFADISYKINILSSKSLNEKREEVFSMTYKLKHLLDRSIQESNNKLETILRNTVFKADLVVQKEKAATLPSIWNKIDNKSASLLETERLKVENLSELLNYLNPEKILKSGYTISTVEGKDVHLSNLEELTGKTMKTLTSNQLITSKIIETKKMNHGDKK